MATNTDQHAKCGNVPISYPSECTYVCYCTPSDGCHWAVTCGTWTTGGKGITKPGSDEPQKPLHPQAIVYGKLEAIAAIFEKRWKRPVIVPKELLGTTVSKRTVKGTPEQIAKALGLEFEPKKD